MRSYKLSLILLVVGVAAFAAAPTFASTVLFQDDFESGTVGSLPGPAAVGTWAFTGDATNNQVVNTGAPTAPAAGVNYLQQKRTGVWSESDAIYASQSAGAVLRFEADLNVVGNMSFYAGNYPAPGSGNDQDAFFLQAHPDGAILAPTPSGTLGITCTPGQWQHWTIDYTVGASTFDLTVGDSTATGLSLLSGGSALPFNFLMLASISGTNYVDNVTITLNPSPVPEPASIALLVSALVGLVAYALRKRR
jgi:hypothetical protein